MTGAYEGSAAEDRAAEPGMIAIDGPSAAGKSSTAHEVAGRLGLVHLNSGLLYRAITWLALRDGWLEELAGPAELAGSASSEASDESGFDERLERLSFAFDPDPPSFLLRVNGEIPGPWLQSAQVTARVSEVAAREAVRARVLEALRAAGRETGVVIDGRDIGTAVFPDARLKIYLTATAEERARRRLAERGQPTPAEAVASEASVLRERDRRDAERAIAPLARADDAIELDTTGRGPGEVVDEIVRLYEARRSGAG